jgi:hypothetical protein
MSIAGVCYITIDYGVYGTVLFLVFILSTSAISIFFINALYILILKVTTPQRFQSIISYVQIFFAIFMYGSYQFFPRMLNQLNLDTFNITLIKGIAAYPMYWLANSWQVFYTIKGSTTEIVFALAGLLLPFISIFIVVRYLAPSFNKRLALLNSNSSSLEKTRSKRGKPRSSYAHILSNLFTKNGAEKAGFLFTWKMTSRSRDFKIKVYPSMGYMMVYVVVLFMNSKSMSLADLHNESSGAKGMILGAIYFTSFLLITAVGQIIYSEKFKAAWIYYTRPLENPGQIISGAAKAAILKFYIPIVVIISVAGIVLIGPRVLPNIILGLFNEVLIAAILVYAGKKVFPFSLQQSTNAQTGGFLRGMFVLAVSGLIGVGHFLIYSFLPVIAICAVLSVAASWLLMDSIKKMGWEKIRSSYANE